MGGDTPPISTTMAHLLSDEPLPFGKLTLVQRDYREFACSKSTALWLQGGAMTSVDGQNVTLQIVDEYDHNVMVKWTPEGINAPK